VSSRLIRPTREHASHRSASRGAFLVEALIAILVFSIAAAGLFTLLSNALRTSSNALWRTEATDVAASALARMSTEDLATLADRYDSLAAGPGFRALVATAKRLPGVTDTTNLPVVSIAPGPSANSQRVSVTVFWHPPNESAPHRASMTSVVAPR
jgi:type IV pilus assembly protein PilV